MTLPDNGIAAAKAKWDPVITGTSRCSIVDGFGKESPNAVRIVAVAPIEDKAGALHDAGHAGMCLGQARFVNTEKHPVEAIDAWMTRSASSMGEGVRNSLKHQPRVVSTSYRNTIQWSVLHALEETRKADVAWSSPSLDSTAYPADFSTTYRHVICALCVTPEGALRGRIPDGNRLNVMAFEGPNASAVTARAAFCFGWLAALKPSATSDEIIRCMNDGCEPRDINAGRVPWYRHDRAADLLMEGMAAPIPEPTPIPEESSPEPEPEPMQVFENDYFRITFTDDLVNEERGEGLPNLLADDNNRKCLFQKEEVVGSIYVKKPFAFTHYRTANDCPNRDLSELETGGYLVSFALAPAGRHQQIDFGPITMEVGEHTIRFKNKGVDKYGRNLTQLEALGWQPIPEETPDVDAGQGTVDEGQGTMDEGQGPGDAPSDSDPDPEPDPDAGVYPVSMTLTYSNGHEERYELA